MQLRHRGELDLLKEIRERFKASFPVKESGVITGIGDDAAVIAPPADPVLITTDMMNEGVHFDLAYTAPVHLGFKLVSVNVSDIMAMGGRPRYVVLSLSMRGDLDDRFFREFFDGVAAALDHYGMALVGGDLSGT
ncbi:MAG TPA: AIR synthase related protein, partial [Dissulfurispiraceae bacterium]|nr:AIR synthase related protein [Dissulfurispiraceae bacterium]